MQGGGNKQEHMEERKDTESRGEEVAAKFETISDVAPDTNISNGTKKALDPTSTQTSVDTVPSLPVEETTDTPRAKEDSQPRLNGDEPKSAPDSELPALLLRLGPTPPDEGPTIPKGSLLRNAPALSSLPPRPRVDTWIAADIKPLRPHTDSYIAPAPRPRTDSYIAPRSPSPKRYEGQANISDRRRRDRSPIRVRHDEGRMRDGDRFTRTDDSLRRVQRSPRGADLFPSKRRRTEGDGHRDEREDVRRETRDHRSRETIHDSRREHDSKRERGSRHGHDPRHGHESRYEHNSHADHKDSRRDYQRGSSVDRKPHIDDRASSEERRDRRRSEHRDDRRSGARAYEDEDRRVNGDARRSTHEGDRRDPGSERGRKEVEDHVDSRNGRQSGRQDIRSEDVQEHKVKDDRAVPDRWRIQSGEGEKKRI